VRRLKPITLIVACVFLASCSNPKGPPPDPAEARRLTELWAKVEHFEPAPEMTLEQLTTQLGAPANVGAGPNNGKSYSWGLFDAVDRHGFAEKKLLFSVMIINGKVCFFQRVKPIISKSGPVRFEAERMFQLDEKANRYTPLPYDEEESRN
jgi:hypothetical protein